MTNNEIFIGLFAVVVVVFFGYAALMGLISRNIGVKKHEKEYHGIVKGYAEIEKARTEHLKVAQKEEVA